MALLSQSMCQPSLQLRSRRLCFKAAVVAPARPSRLAQRLAPVMSADPGTEPSASEFEELDSESARKKAEADRLRAAEKFMVIGSGTAVCKGCGYEYAPDKGDPDFPVPKGVLFQVGGMCLQRMTTNCMIRPASIRSRPWPAGAAAVPF
eukprot:GHRQ01006174.1.p1 GENE.GHRQ01006174.1~~GHRQ01006174.1.p1  ORF type:complete len:149 (+),score=45.11 GHRQ01006174.1:192-638(+)